MCSRRTPAARAHPQLADAGTVHPQTVALRPLSKRNAQKRLAGVSDACFAGVKVSQGALVRLDGAIQGGAVVQVERRAVVVGQVASGNGQTFASWRRFDLGGVGEKR